MIGNLLRTAASTFSHQSTPRSQPPLESVQEEAHTRDLLFPDLSALRTNFHNELPFQSARPATARDAASFDDRGNLDLSYPSDIRIIIAQDANSRYHQPQVLFDSKPHKSLDPRSGSLLNEQEPSSKQSLVARGKSMTTPSRRGHTPSNSLFSAQIPPMSPTSPRSPEAKTRSFFGDSRARAPAFDIGAFDQETTQGKLAREAKEETDALLGCMFGAPGFRLEASTKIHVVPKKAPDGPKSPGGPRPISSGGFNRRRTPLVRSTSAADVSKEGWSPAASSDPSDTRSQASKPAVMVTRLFTVNLPESETTETEDENLDAPPVQPTRLEGSYTEQQETQTKRVKQKKVPMYAIAVVLQLPPDLDRRVRPTASQGGLSSLGSSLNDQTPANSWRGEQSTFSSFMEIRGQTALDSVLNPNIAQVMQHWNVLSRSIELLETFAKVKLKVLLEQCSPPPVLVPQPRPGLVNLRARKPMAQSQRSVYVDAECFQTDSQIKKSSEIAAQTIVSGLKTRRVVVGQGRWGAWREEARWVGRWAGSKEQNFFFFTFLTAFLGSHTAWLETLSPSWYRRKHAQQRYQPKDGSRIPQRTVIIASEKMAARRLIFLLSTFFPNNFNHVAPFIPMLSSSQPNATSFGSGSPPTLPLRDQPLHKSATTRRTGGIQKEGSDSRNHTHVRSVSFSLIGGGGDNESAITDIYTAADRFDSDARSLRSPSLAIPHRGTDSRKASLSTVTADAAQAVPHFSNLIIGQPNSPSTEKRPGSGGSIASNALSQNLKRSESSNLSTSASGRWGSVMSGFWGRRDSTTDDSDVFISSQDSPTRVRSTRAAGPLQAMVEQVEASDGPASVSASPNARPLPSRLEDCLVKPQHPAHGDGGSLARSIPRRPKPERLPLKLSFNESEGYIDVAMPVMQSFTSSLASSFASIRLPQPSQAVHGEHYSPYGSVTSDSSQPRSEPNIDVAGWLKTFHPDFVLQAVKPYDDLVKDVKSTMYAEAQLISNTLHPNERNGQHKWSDVCSTLLADTTNFTVSRLRLRRRLRPQPSSESTNVGTKSEFAVPSSPRFADPRYEVEIVSEPVMDLDAILIDAVERVLAQSGSSSRAPSRGPSRAPSRGPSRPPSPPRSPRPASTHSGRSGRTTNGSRRGTDLGADSLAQSQLEVPKTECRRMVLGALEEVVRSVVEEREYEEHSGTRRSKVVIKEGGGVIRRNTIERRDADDGVAMDEQQDGANDGNRRGSIRGRAKVRETDSTLREGVRKWLVSVEDGSFDVRLR